MPEKLVYLRLFLLFICSLLIGLWFIATHSLDVMAAQVASSAPTTSVYVMQDFESGGAVIQSWWNSTVTTEGPNSANAYEGDYYGRIVINGAGSTNPIFQDAIWGASHIDISSYARVCMWVFDETTIAGTHLGLILRNSDESVTTTQLRSTQSTSPGGWRKICWNLADFDNQSVMTQFFMMTLFPESLPEIAGNNVDGGPLRIDYVHFESAAMINCASNEVGGRIFLDQNSNTLNEMSEVGYSGATVTVYDNTGTSTTVTTDASGYYSTTAFSAGTDLRVELTVPTGFESAAAGNTTVLFTQAGMCEQDIGIYQTAQYCEENPQMATACYVAGTYDGDNAGLDAIVSYPYDATGIAHDGTGTPPVHAALVGDVGTTWGMGYQRQTETLYTTAFVKRLSDLGPLGTGGIYKLDYSNPSTPVVSNFVNISVTLSIDTGPDPRDGTLHNASLPISGMVPVRDQNAYLNVGKVSMGDMDISSNGNTMWFVNLYDQSLYGITNLDPNTPPVPGDVLGPYDIAAENPGCNAASDVRPWGLNYSNSTVYVGLVCSAESTGQAADLHAYVLAFDPATSTFDPTPVVDFSLTERTACPYWFSQPDACSWRPWGSTEHVEGTNPQGFNPILNPQPILADIEFDNDGSMVIAFLDRHGHQSGLQNYSGDTNDSNPNYSGMAGGDIVRICNNNGTLQLEQGGICPNGNTENGYGGSISGLHNGIYGTAEYYKDDTRANDPTHAESASGGLALHPSSGEVGYSTMNPIGNTNSGGIRWNSNTTGQMTRGYELYQEYLPAPAFGKATGIGDVELLCSLPNIEVGNRVWHDSNMNGIQDPGESVLPNVVVELLDVSNTVIATATTDANGLYLFSSGLAPANPSTGAVYNVAGLSPNTANYKVRIAKNDAALGGLSVTTSNAEGDVTNGITDLRDSDAISNGSYAEISFDTGADGANNHTLDFGFVYEPPGTIAIVKNTADDDGTFTFSSIDPDLDNVIITTTANLGTSSVITKAAGIYTITEDFLAGWTLAAITVTESLTNNSSAMLGSNSVNLVLDAGENITITFQNEIIATAQITVGNYVWVDSDLDGLQDNGEPVLSGVQVELRTINGTLVATTTTDVNGFYAFTEADGMAPSTDYLIVIPEGDPVLNAGGYTSTMPDQGNDDAADSDAVFLGDKGGLDWSTDGTSAFDHAIEITSPASGSDLTYDFGFTGAIEHGCDSDSSITLQSIGLGGSYASHTHTFTIPNPSNVIGVIAEAGWRVNFDGTDLPTEATFTGSNGITATVTGGKLIETVAYNNNPGKFNTTIYRAYLAGNMSSVTLTTPMDGSGDPFALNLYVLRSSGGENQASNLFFIDKFTGSVDGDLPQNATTIAPLLPSPISSDYTFLAPIGEAGTKGALINLSAGGVDNSGSDVYPEPSPNPYGSDVYIQEMLLTNIPANTSSLNLYQSEAPSSNSSFILTGFMATAESCSEDAMPSLALSKTLNTPEPVDIGMPISFTIRITNTGDATITTLPLTDTYDTTYLVYDSVNGSTPATDNNINDGQLEWSDLTVIEGDLAPGDTIDVVVHFTANADTSALAAQPPCANAGESCNVAAVNNATAGPDPVPPVEDSDDVAIEELFTGKSTLGDFVWYDTNGDGIKDPGEPGINGVIINLYGSTGWITTTVTMSDTGGIGDDTGVTNGDGFYDFLVVESTVYTVEIDSSNFDPGGALEGYSYSGNNATMPYNGDETRVVLMPAVQHDENNVDFSYVAPIFELSKTLNTYLSVRVGDPVSFTIRITNTGTVVMNSVPLIDEYNSAYLDYVSASPLPDSPVAGELSWNDLTAAGSTGFGTDLNPGETFTVDVVFTAMLDTTGLPNDSTANLAASREITDTAEVQAFAPTSVALATRDVIYVDNHVMIRWETADETNVAGFHIYRQAVDEEDQMPVQLTQEPFIAEKSGSSSGTVYTYTDRATQAGVAYRYFVGILDTSGLESRDILGDVITPRTINEWLIFLPITLK